MKRQHSQLLIATTLVALAASARIFNAGMNLHNFVPIAGIALFSGAAIRQNRPLAILVPLLGQFLADVYFQLFTSTPGFYSVTSQLFNYAAIGAAAGLGFLLKQPKVANVLGFTLGASFTFFLVSNMGYFLQGYNGYSFSGLMKTYVDAIPFYEHSFIADVVASPLMFGFYAIFKKQVSAHIANATA